MHAETAESATVLGSSQATFSFRPVQQLAKETDFEKRWGRGEFVGNISTGSINFRISVNQGWWMKLRQINDVLAKHDSIYEKEALDPDTFEVKYLSSGPKV